MSKEIHTPIRITRTPIIVERLPWDEVYEKFVKLIRFAAKNVNNTFHTEGVEDLFQEGQIVLYRCWLFYGDKDMSNFSTIFKAALWRKLREISGKKRHFTVDFETMTEKGLEPGYEPDFESQIDDSLNLQKLADLLKDKPVAMTILKEFISPGERTLWESRMDFARKETLKNQNYSISLPSSVIPNRKTIRRGMEIGEVKFNQAFNELKTAMRQVYGN